MAYKCFDKNSGGSGATYAQRTIKNITTTDQPLANGLHKPCISINNNLKSIKNVKYIRLFMDNIWDVRYN